MEKAKAWTSPKQNDWEIVRTKRKGKGVTRLNCVLCCFMSRIAVI